MQPDEEKETDLAEDQGQFAKNPASSPQASGTSKILRCPKCGGSRIRKRSRYLIISIVVFVGLLVLLRLVGLFRFHIIELSGFLSSIIMTLSLVLLAISIVWPTVICGAACFAFVGRHHCLGCGHRFRSIGETKQTKAETPFPWRFCILNGVILFFVCMASREMLKLMFHGAFSIIVFKAIFAAFPAAFLIALSLPYQAIVHRLFRTRIRHNLLWAILFLLPAVVFGGFSVYRSLPRVQARTILAHAQLAPLPESATEIKVYTWSSPMSGEEFLRFRANPDDIQRFLDESPILEGKECEKFSKERMRIEYPKDYGTKAEHLEHEHEYFYPDPTAPDWYIEEIKGTGRRYEIQPEGYHYPGEVIVNDKKHVVFVMLVFS